MKKKHYLVWSFAAALAMMTMNSCSEENSNPQEPDNSMESDANYVGKAQDGFTAEEWYPGGELGTTENVNSGCYEDEAPAVNEQGLHDNFKTGEMFFERQYTIDNGAFKGVGPCLSAQVMSRLPPKLRTWYATGQLCHRLWQW